MCVCIYVYVNTYICIHTWNIYDIYTGYIHYMSFVNIYLYMYIYSISPVTLEYSFTDWHAIFGGQLVQVQEAILKNHLQMKGIFHDLEATISDISI